MSYDRQTDRQTERQKEGKIYVKRGETRRNEAKRSRLAGRHAGCQAGLAGLAGQAGQAWQARKNQCETKRNEAKRGETRRNDAKQAGGHARKLSGRAGW